MKMSKIYFFFTLCYRVHEHTSNPKMKFMTKIKLNDHVVSKGFGQNKKASKTAAA